MEEFPSNSVSGSQPAKDEKKIESVVENPVTLRKKSPGKRFLDMFIMNSPREVAANVFWEVAVPALKDAVVDYGQESLHRVVQGGPAPRRGRASQQSTATTVGKVAYHHMSGEKAGRTISRQARAQHDFAEITLTTRPEAEGVLGRLYEVLEQYGQVSVYDLYDLVGITEKDYTAQKYGWTDLAGSGIQISRGGYQLNLPRPVVLD